MKVSIRKQSDDDIDDYLNRELKLTKKKTVVDVKDEREFPGKEINLIKEIKAPASSKQEDSEIVS